MARVDEQARGAGADEVGVGALEGEFGGVAGEEADAGGGEAVDLGEGGEGGHFGGVGEMRRAPKVWECWDNGMVDFIWMDIYACEWWYLARPR